MIQNRKKMVIKRTAATTQKHEETAKVQLYFTLSEFQFILLGMVDITSNMWYSNHIKIEFPPNQEFQIPPLSFIVKQDRIRLFQATTFEVQVKELKLSRMQLLS